MQNKREFYTSLEKLLSFKSYQQKPEPNMPFGKGVAEALAYFLSLAKSMGFNTKNYDNYMGEVYFGEGEELGIIGHLDVVPEGAGWNTDPYTLTEIDGKLFARGILDDKAPLLLCLYALDALKNSGVKFNKKVRLLLGTNEESGWKDVEYFKTKSTFPKWGFSPDGDFPVSYSEKGTNAITFKLPLLKNFKDFKGGNVINAVCNYASVKGTIDEDLLKKHGLTHNGDIIESHGKASHGAYPELGKNAILPILRYALDMGENVKNIIEYLFEDKLGIKKLGNETGLATLSPDLIFEEKGELVIVADFRVPAKMRLEEFLPIFDKMNIKYTAKKGREPLYTPKDSELVTKLMSAYNEVMKVTAEPINQRGATFASVFSSGVAFGPEIPGEQSTIHEPNEYMYEKNIEIMYEIYKKGIYALIK